MANITLASSLDGKEHLAAWDQLFEFRFAAIELEKLLIMMFDTVDSKALPYLADQFDLLGVKGWNAAKTEQDRRNLIKRAIELKRYQGTNYAIRRAVQSVGYYDAEILEGVGAFYNGQFVHNGFINHGTGNWATFAVILDIGEAKGIGLSETSEAVDLINEYKNARSLLLFVNYKCTLIDTVIETEDFSLLIDNQSIEYVDPLNEELNFVATQAEINEAISSSDVDGLTINFINSQGEVLQQAIF